MEFSRIPKTTSLSSSSNRHLLIHLQINLRCLLHSYNHIIINTNILLIPLLTNHINNINQMHSSNRISKCKVSILLCMTSISNNSSNSSNIHINNHIHKHLIPYHLIKNPTLVHNISSSSSPSTQNLWMIKSLYLRCLPQPQSNRPQRR